MNFEKLVGRYGFQIVVVSAIGIGILLLMSIPECVPGWTLEWGWVSFICLSAGATWAVVLAGAYENFIRPKIKKGEAK